jgi:hypothetical protein
MHDLDMLFTSRRRPFAALERVTVGLSALEAVSPRTPPDPPFVRGGEFERTGRLLFPPLRRGGTGRFFGSFPEARASQLLTALVVALAALAPSGCRRSSEVHAVDPPRAREALKTALDAWKGGQSPESLKSSSTPMTIQDLDWAGGAKLIDYQILDDGKALDANLSIRVKLVLDGRDKKTGKANEKKVWYLVTTSPSVTVFRDAFRR